MNIEEGTALIGRLTDDQRNLIVEMGNVFCDGATLAGISERMGWDHAHTKRVLDELEALGAVTAVQPVPPAPGVKVHHLSEGKVTPLTPDQQALADLIGKLSIAGHMPRVLVMARELGWSAAHTAEVLSELQAVGIVSRHQMAHA